MARMGPLLQGVLQRMVRAGPALVHHEMLAVAAHVGATHGGDRLPLLVKFGERRPQAGETWPEFRDRVAKELDPMRDVLSGGRAQPLYLANALAGAFRSDQATALMQHQKVDVVELDPVVNPTVMDD